MKFPSSIFEFVKTEEKYYQTHERQVLDNVFWNMRKHIETSVAFKFGYFMTAPNDYRLKPPFKKLILPLLRVKYAARDIDVKDIHIYVDEPEKHYLSFLVKKYHDEVFTQENDLDLFFDKALEQAIDLGGVIAKKGEKILPEVLPLEEIAFCDQTKLLGGPIGWKFNFSPDELRLHSKQGWGDKKFGATITLDELIKEAKQEVDATLSRSNRKVPTTGKNIQVYVVRGQMPESYLKDGGDDEKIVNQVQIVAFYQGKNGNAEQIIYRAPEKEEVLKAYTASSEKMQGRALGLGGVEELFDIQIWANFLEINKMNMIKAAAKNVLYTDDPAYANRNKIKDMENLEITVVDKGSRIETVPTASPNIQIFAQALNEWEEHAKEIAGVSSALAGQLPTGRNTSFRLLGAILNQAQAPHKREQGKFTKWIEEIYRDWLIPAMAKEIVKGKKFLTTLSWEEMNFLSERISSNQASKAQIESILNGELPEDYQTLKTKFKDEFIKGGNQRFIEILKDELKDVQYKVKIDIAGKQKDLNAQVEALTRVVQQYMAMPPQAQQNPVILRMLNEIMEYSGLSPIDFSVGTPQETAQQAQPQIQAPTQNGQPLNLSQMSPQFAPH